MARPFHCPAAAPLRRRHEGGFGGYDIIVPLVNRSLVGSAQRMPGPVWNRHCQCMQANNNYTRRAKQKKVRVERVKRANREACDT